MDRTWFLAGVGTEVKGDRVRAVRGNRRLFLSHKKLGIRHSKVMNGLSHGLREYGCVLLSDFRQPFRRLISSFFGFAHSGKQRFGVFV
ncbi:MAG: hypothetical protein KF812_03150 [Fimbriimonadaceae bacterium]|nr:hypothetical protein [Fimbriimonadaceae bacterium]